jgi:serine/threonine-protein kinase
MQLSVAMVGLSQSVYAQVDEAFKTYENPKFGLALSYPPDWTVDELRNDPAAPSNNSIVAIFKSPSQGENDKYLENVIINVQGPRSDIASLETYTSNSEKAFNNMSDTIKITKSGKDTLAGLPAHQLLYTSTGIPGLNLEKMQVFTVVNNNTAYVVTFGAEQAEYDKNIQDVEKMLNSIKVDRDAMKNVQQNQNEPT